MPRHQRADAIAHALVEEALRSGAQTLSLAGLRITSPPSNLPDLAGSLTELDLSDCRQLSDLSPLASLTNLQSLNLSDCRQLSDLSPLNKLTALQTLDLSNCDHLSNLSPLANLTALQSLDLSFCDQLSNLNPLAKLTALQSLKLSGCDHLSDLSPLAKLTALQKLNLRSCDQLSDLSPLAKLTALQSLDLSYCHQLSNLSPLAKLTALQILNLSSCNQLSNLRPLAKLTDLQTLNLSGCDQLSDLSPLAKLTDLQTLNLIDCHQLSDLSPLAMLTALQMLDLRGCDQLSDLSTLALLTALQSLQLSYCDNLSDLSPLAALTNLQSLDLSGYDQLSDLSTLALLTALQSLQLSYCDNLSDLSPLAALTNLRSLDLSGCDQLSDLSPLAKLTDLQTLNLTDCHQLLDLSLLAKLTALQTLDLSSCNQLSDLSPLASLAALQTLVLSHCNQLSDLSPLASLAALQTLVLSHCNQLSDLSSLAPLAALHTLSLSGCDQLSDLSPLAKLTALQSLDLSGCGQLSDLSHLTKLTALHSLDLSGCSQPSDLETLSMLDAVTRLVVVGAAQGLISPDHVQRLWPRLNWLETDTLSNVPRELQSGDFNDNCLKRIEDWQQAVETHGSTPFTDVKLFLLGNGRVGKTQLARRLCGEAFDDTVPSTHGVVLRQFPLARSAAVAPGPDAGDAWTVRLWDFGGQDLFLGTHSLFLDDRALYVLLWYPDGETDTEVWDHGVCLPSHRLAYWLDYVRATTEGNAPVIVVQARCDTETLLTEAPVPPDHGFAWLRRSACSAREADGLDRLLPELRAGAKLLAQRHGEVLLPNNWARLGAALREIGATQQVLPQEDYRALCEQHGVQAPDTLLNYLHQSGQVFWQPGVFGGAVILDQAWALDGVYALLHREKVLPTLRRQGGSFTPELLAALLWDGLYDQQEQAHFLSLMQSCQVCFKVGEGRYMAPDCLLDREAMAAQEQAVWRGAQANAVVHLQYELLHTGLQRAALCELGELAGPDAVYWRYGLCLHDAKERVTLRVACEPGEAEGRSGFIAVETSGLNAGAYAQRVVKHLLERTRMGRPPEVQWIKGSAVDDPSAHLRGKANDDDNAVTRPIHPAPLPAGVTSTKEKPVAFVSYAWGGDSDATVEGLQKALAPWVEVHRDRDVMRTGDSIRKFEQEIGRGLCVIVVLSAKYMRSVDCMRELSFVWERAQRQAEAFAERVVPVVLDDAQLNTLAQRLQHIKHWQNELRTLEELVKEIGPVDCGQSTTQQLQDIRTFSVHLADALNALGDRVMPRGYATLSEQSFAPVVDLVKRRLGLN